MKKIVLGAVVACATSQVAVAADVPGRQVFFDPNEPAAAFAPSFPVKPTAPVFVEPVPPPFDWTGLYLGLNAGYAFSRTDYALSGTGPTTYGALQTGAVPASFGARASGFTGGGQLGFNKQLDSMLISPLAKIGGGVVLGLEADAAYTGLNSTNVVAGSGGVVTTTLHDRTEFVGTARGRVGLAFNRLMVFGTGGFAYGGVDTAANVTVADVSAATGSKSGLRTGYVYGGGLEYAFAATPLFKVFMAPAVTLRVEYLHYDLGSSTVATSTFLGTSEAFNVASRDNGNIVRVAVSYKFDVKIPPPPY